MTKKKKIIVYAAVIAVIVTAAIVFAVVFSVRNKPYYINFRTNSEQHIVSMRFKSYEEKTMPVPVKLGYDFAGWYYDEALSEPFVFSEYKKRKQPTVTVYAKWTPAEVTGKFYYADVLIDTQTVLRGHQMTPPEIQNVPVGHEVRWYADDKGLPVTDFTAPTDRVYYGHLERKEYSITLEMSGRGEEVLYVLYEDYFTEALFQDVRNDWPSYDLKLFSDRACTVELALPVQITSDVTFYMPGTLKTAS